MDPHHDAFTVVVALLGGASFARLQSVSRAYRDVLRGYEAAFYAARTAAHAWFFGPPPRCHNLGNNSAPALARYLRLRKATKRLIFFGGSSNRGDQDQYLSSVEEFEMVAGPGLVPSGTAPPALRFARDACALARSVDDLAGAGIFAVGGWDGERALATVESLSPDGAVWVVHPHKLNRARCFTASVVTGGGTLLVFGGGEHLYQGAEVFTSTEASSFLTPGMSARGRFHIRPELELLVPRTGHCCAINRVTNQVLVVAGYGGGSIYRRTVELLDLTSWRSQDMIDADAAGGAGAGAGAGAGGHKQTSSTLFRPVPHQLSKPRTGCVGGFGPHGSFYCCGGSTDGGDAVSLCERLDLREPIGFELKTPMLQRRGYFSGCFAPDGRLYVSGGSHLMPAELQFHDGVPHVIRPQVTTNSIECYDPRMDK